MKLLLVDNRVADKAIIKSSLLGDVDMVEFDFFGETTESLVSKITNKNYSSIGLFQENYDREVYSLISSVVGGLVKDVSTIDSDLGTWYSILSLLFDIKKKTNFTTLDLMGCGIYSSNDWKYIISGLETKLTININASIDYTGDVSLGGNWILEEGNVNLIGKYFTSNIKEYKHILGGQGTATYVISNVETEINSDGLDTGKVVKDINGNYTGYNNSILYGVGTNVADLNPVVYSFDFIKVVNSDATSTSAVVTGVTSFYIDTNGKLWVTGLNAYGQLGTNDTDVRPIWVKLPNELLDLTTNNLSVIDVFGEYNNSRFTYILLSDGSVWHTGLNTGFGNNKKFTKIYNPAINGGKKAVKITGMSDQLAIIFNDGTASFSRFSGSIANSLTYFSGKTVVGIDSGYDMSAVLFSDGTAAAWNVMENVPNANITTSGSPYRYFDFPTGVTGFTKLFITYARQILLIDNNGAIWVGLGNYTSGDKGFVKIYNPTTNNNLKAIKVYCDIYSQDSNGLINMNGQIFVLLENGSLMAGGRNYWGSFGNSSFTQNQYLNALQTVYTPTDLINGTDKIVNVSFANSCTIITKQDSSVWVAGYNNNTFGTYPTNSTNYIVDLTTTKLTDNIFLTIHPKQVSTNGFSTAVVTADNKLYTKGQNNAGQLGLGNNTDVSNFTLVDTTSILTGGLKIEFISIGGGFIPGGAYYGHLLMVVSDGSVWATGYNNFGQAGYGKDINNNDIEISNIFRKIYTPNPSDEQSQAFTCSAGKLDSMFVLKNGKVYKCNITNKNIGPTVAYTPDLTPTIPGDKYPAIYASAGPFHSGIITADGSVWMTGNDQFASNQYNNATPFSAFGLGSFTDDELLEMFPEINTLNNEETGYIGNYNTYSVYSPLNRPLYCRISTLNTFVRTYRPENNGGIGAALLSCGGDSQGANFTAIFLLNGSIYTTGSNVEGQLGKGDYISTGNWTKVFDPNVAQTPAKTVLCAEYSTTIIYGGGVYSTGANITGQLGTGNNNRTNTFVPMKNINTFGTLTNGFALNDAEGLVITAPAFGPFEIESKLYGSDSFIVLPPESVSQGAFSFTSSDPTIASIDSVTGEITINNTGNLGTVTIRATQAPWSLYTDYAFTETTFTVLPLNPELANFNIPQKWFNTNDYTSPIDNSEYFGTSPFSITPPTSLSQGAFSYNSSNTNVATINELTGEITIVGVGSTFIQASQNPNGIYDSASIGTTFTVNSLISPNLSTFSISNKLYSITETSFTPTLPVQQASTSFGSGIITYSISNNDIANSPTDIATIDSSTGEITYGNNNKIGTVKVTATISKSGKYDSAFTSATFTILPINPNLRVFANESIILGKTNHSLTAPVSDNTVGLITYTSSDETIATVDSVSGEITTISEGTTIITASQEANGIYDTATINKTLTVLPRISPNLRGFTNESKAYGSNNFYISVTQDSNTGSIIYTSSDETIATINSVTGEVSINTNGKIGTTTITATHNIYGIYKYETISKTLIVTAISPNLRSFSIAPISFEYNLPPLQITAPLYNGNGILTYSSDIIDQTIGVSNPKNVATINSQTGYITILNPGKTTIRASLSAANQYYTESINTTLIVYPLNNPNLTLLPNNSESITKICGILPFTISYTSLSNGNVTITTSDTNILDVISVDNINKTAIISVKKDGEANIIANQEPTNSYDFGYNVKNIIVNNTTNSSPILLTETNSLINAVNNTNTSYINLSGNLSNINKLKRTGVNSVKILNNSSIPSSIFN